MASGRMARVECEGVSVFLLLVLAALHHTVKAEEKMLDMAPDAVDDDFSDCRDKMLKVVQDDLLQKELAAEEQFKEIWSKNSKICRKMISGGTPLHTDALQAYGNSKTTFRKKFNDLVYSKGNNNMTYREKFNFKSLHFLLTDSLRLLKPENCRTVYYGTSNIYTAVPGTQVRFGKFIKPTFKKSSATEFLEDEGSLFIINSCSVVNVEENTCKIEEFEGLISPAEVFTVQKVEGSEYREITLNHSRFLSNHHCSFFHRSDLLPDGSSAPPPSFRMLLAVLTYILSNLLLMSLL
ncbi:hypothetical protein KOW79_022781 [Hemibagrus wyckioides]|uniref:NAD(P)(+)--arginine ADP-ribosyltransferase n=1 Tax=Hemibagrus wyckioides TaxID=337641 RepID=A0A9D3S8I8_9TELE|nr:hypothetical protein KOW79_022781 [Hemibagrus wyckioides]